MENKCVAVSSQKTREYFSTLCLKNGTRVSCFVTFTVSSATVAYLHQVTLEFIHPDLWPPISPDLNPVDYKYEIWGFLQNQVYQKCVCDVDELKQYKVMVRLWTDRH